MSQKTAAPVTLDDVLEIFPGAVVVPEWPPPIPLGHQPLLDAARRAGFPWLRLRPDFAVGGHEDSWRAWLEGFVSPADLILARQLVDRGEGIITRATTGEAPATPPRTWRDDLSETFTSSPAQRSARCGGREWRRTLDGDVCTVCPPFVAPPASAFSPYRWTKAPEPTMPRAPRKTKRQPPEGAPEEAPQEASEEAPSGPVVVPHLHHHECPSPGDGVRRAFRCRRTFPCTAPGCAQQAAYRCACCKLEVIERRSRRQRLAASFLRLVPR